MILAIDPLLANLCGFVGMACVIGVYAYITAVKRPNPFLQHGVNLAGTGLLTISLLVNLNPASLVLEGFFSAIAVWGLVKATLERKENR